MLAKAALIFVLLGTVCSEPIKRSIVITPSDVIPSVISDYADQFKISVGPETMKYVKNFINNVVGLKLSALEIGVKMIQWLISNLVGIAIGVIVAIGICKITGKCGFSYDSAFSNLYSLMSSDQLDLAQNLLISALRRFEQETTEEEEEKQEEDDEKADGDNE